MNRPSPGSEVALAPGEVLSFDCVQGMAVRVLSGRLWITEESRPEDIWLRAGERAHLTGEGIAVVEAVGDARIRFDCH